jgi:hypothetical protein
MPNLNSSSQGLQRRNGGGNEHLEELLETLSRAKNQMRKITANQNSAVQPMTVKGEYASVGDLNLYYEIHGTV